MCSNVHVATLVDSDWIAVDVDTDVVAMPGLTPSVVITNLAFSRRKWMISTNHGTWHIPDTHMYEVAIGNEVAKVAMIPTVCRIRNVNHSVNVLGVVGKFASGATALFPVSPKLYPHGDDSAVVSLRDVLSGNSEDSPAYAHTPTKGPLGTRNYAEVLSNWMIQWKLAPWEMDIHGGVPAGWDADFEFLLNEHKRIEEQKKMVDSGSDIEPEEEEESDGFVTSADAPTFANASVLEQLRKAEAPKKPERGQIRFQSVKLDAALKKSKKAKPDPNDGFAPLRELNSGMKAEMKLLT